MILYFNDHTDLNDLQNLIDLFNKKSPIFMFNKNESVFIVNVINNLSVSGKSLKLERVILIIPLFKFHYGI